MTWINTRVVIDMESGKVLERHGYWYVGQVAHCKGDHSSAEQAAADAQRAEENAIMQQQLGLQMKQINAVNSVLDPIIQAGGMTPQEQAAMQGIAINQLPQDFNQLFGNVSQQLAARGISGGQNAGGGQIASQYGSLGAMEDFMKSNLLENVQLQKANLLRQALGAKMGVAGMFGNNVGIFNQGMGQALGQGVQAAYNADQAATSWMGPVFGALGSLGGAAIGLAKPSGG